MSHTHGYVTYAYLYQQKQPVLRAAFAMVCDVFYCKTFIVQVAEYLPSLVVTVMTAVPFFKATM